MKKIIHIGQMKSGTTYIQNALHQNRDALREAGYIYPGFSFNQQHACYGLCGSDVPWIRSGDKWKELSNEMLSEINDGNSNVIISSEALSCMADEGVARFVGALNGIDHVIVTVRNFHKVLLSAWQQSVKGGSAKSFSAFMASMSEDRSRDRGMWRNYSFGSTVERWSRYAKISFIIAGNNAEENDLLERFLSECKLPNLSVRKMSTAQSNRSLKREDVELLRYFNEINKGMAVSEREAYVRWLLRKGFFPAAATPVGTKIRMNHEHLKLSKAWVADELSKVRNSENVSVIGDIDDLLEAGSDDIETEPSTTIDGYSLAARSNFILNLIFNSVR